MFTAELLQAVSDWQRGGDSEQKRKRGQRLKELAGTLDLRFRQCGLVVYRQIALGKRPIWQLLADSDLPETISAWTLSAEVAKQFKGGVPPEGWQGVIVALQPPAGSVVVNLDALYRSQDFLNALDRDQHSIAGYADGAKRYGGSQCEVVLEVQNLTSTDIYALGGHSSDRDTLIRLMFQQDPTPQLIAWYEEQIKRGALGPGPLWLEGKPLQRALRRIEPRLAQLKATRAAQATVKSAGKSSAEAT